VYGVETEVAYQPLDNWNISASLAYANSKIKDGVVPCNDFFPADGVPDTVSGVPTVAQIRAASGGDNLAACAVDFRASLSPPWSGNLQSEYYQPLANGMEGYVRGLLQFYGKSQTDPSNAVDDVKSYGILNLYAGLRDHGGAWDVSLYAKNITNTERVLTRSPTAAQTPYNVGATSFNGITSYRQISFTQPREFGVNVRYAFGSR
jgi:iron complex outermembrane receptor protein